MSKNYGNNITLIHNENVENVFTSLKKLGIFPRSKLMNHNNFILLYWCFLYYYFYEFS